MCWTEDSTTQNTAVDAEEVGHVSQIDAEDVVTTDDDYMNKVLLKLKLKFGI